MIDVGDFGVKKKYNFDDFVEIIQILRAPGGCPWDAEQTHQSLRKNFIEETYEVIDTIDSGDSVGMCEELGDVMLQVLMHAQIAAEDKSFDVNDVIDGICKKLVYRHPHVFKDTQVSSSEEVLSNWDALKKVEKHQKSETEVLQSVTKALPALMRAQKVQHKAAKTGMDFDGFDSAKDKLYEEIGELERARAERSNIEEEYGDLLFAAVNLSRFLHIEAEDALTCATNKFIDRFARVEALAQANGKDMREMSPEELDKLWNLAKEHR